MNRLASVMLILAALQGGCANPSDTGEISGLVTWQGKPLAKGRVVFFHASGRSGYGDIGPDGKYRVAAPLGSCNVAISCVKDPPADLKPEEIRPGVYDPKHLIPERFADHMRSGLVFTVESGSSTADWNLTDSKDESKK